MARARKRGRPKKKKTGVSTELIGVMLLVVNFLAIGQFGFVGRFFANILRFFVGETYIIASIAMIIIGIYLLIKGNRPSLKSPKWIGSFLVFCAVVVWQHAELFSPIMDANVNIVNATWRMYLPQFKSISIGQNIGGGMIGAVLYAISYFLFSSAGTYLMMIGLTFVGIMTFFQLSYKALLEKIRIGGRNLRNFIKAKMTSFKEKQIKRKASKENAKKSKNNPKNKEKTDNEIPVNGKLSKPVDNEKSDPAEVEDTPAGQMALKIEGFQQKDIEKNGKEEQVLSDEGTVDFEIGEEENEQYKMPPISLLNKREAVDQSFEYSLIQENVKKLEETFESFGVKATVTKANLGPAVTKYEIQPATGVKVSKIVGLTDDIALALAAKDIRMEAPIPGKALIGIEVPNSEVSMVSFRDVIEGQIKNKDQLLEVPLGRDIGGNVAMADLSKMPHLLVAGATGSGKSVAINGIITSLLLKAKPNEVKLMMIDPKMVELNVYNGIPHLLTPVVTNPKKAAQALHKVVQEMERRYELFAASGTRNMAGYNQFVKKKNEEKEEALLPLPYIVVIVDELADLMMVASNDVEDAITRLAQMARAAGIHMILATQRPSVDVITGIIKANVPSRIAFAVSSGTDSRTILDGNGAEKLLGRGDMLFQPMGENKPNRVQGAFISDEEVEAVVNFVKEQQEANYVEEMIPKDEPKAEQGEAEDDLYEDAVSLVVDMQTASISLLQRRFRIGYNRAARIVDEMEMRGIVGPSEGSKPREVLVQAELEPSQPKDSSEQ
ncbi:FtsK/SpoIIIE family DNA translocase [Marinilactibacillus psychrotolerans]|uniref:DNA translocase FtsK n=1 Tax=Marinilactibacillus psychrotolerans TaxID=191770 RepID=A0AAV3WY23_9LACT|nr:DNA translocase FtsK [Marinilactibacillus psychrotolerans]GEL68163.1 DNA translocase FtsK [Marinilactibacillus psychrotolerans]GEQ36639.1 cell division protein FtsK [Marinilactibacillus psychrotolerans]SDD11398.1 DNA segregation ATPase FtsK/SpoIIIE, S-DNA-T family [Marinilactibacillus psychrotolerans]